MRSLFHRQHRFVDAVGGVSFTIEPGEIVGFLGPNGAGKSTTLKMLSGILSPSTGSARVLGFEPFRRAPILRRSRWRGIEPARVDLPAAEASCCSGDLGLELPPNDPRELIELLDLGALIDKPCATVARA